MKQGRWLSFALFLAACNSGVDPDQTQEQSEPVQGLRFFGYVAVDCGWDDPHDPSSKSSYLDEVQAFTNLAHMCAYGHGDVLVARLDAMKAAGVRPMLDVGAIFFEDVDPDPNVTNYDLAADYAAHWATFVAANQIVARSADLGAIYPVDEPMLNGVTFAELTAATELIDATVPDVAILVVEAYSELAALEVPRVVDWLGFDRYGVADPMRDPEFLADLATLKAKRTRGDQRIALVLEGQHWPAYSDYGFPPEAMGGVAASYYELASSDADVVALLAYLWPGGLDGPTHLGTRDLPEEALSVHRTIGAAITGK